MRARVADRCIALATLAFATASCGTNTQPLPPTQLSEAAIRSDILGHWYKETFKVAPGYRFEIEYRSDGTVFARQWDSAEYPDGTPKVWHHDYVGVWRLHGTTIAHHWTAGMDLGHSAPDLRDCRIRAISSNYMDLEDTVMEYYLIFYRKPTLTQ